MTLLQFYAQIAGRDAGSVRVLTTLRQFYDVFLAVIICITDIDPVARFRIEVCRERHIILHPIIPPVIEIIVPQFKIRGIGYRNVSAPLRIRHEIDEMGLHAGSIIAESDIYIPS